MAPRGVNLFIVYSGLPRRLATPPASSSCLSSFKAVLVVGGPPRRAACWKANLHLGGRICEVRSSRPFMRSKRMPSKEPTALWISTCWLFGGDLHLGEVCEVWKGHSCGFSSVGWFAAAQSDTS